MSRFGNGDRTPHGREHEQEVMSILLGSSLIGEMSTVEREQLLNYLVASYYETRSGERSRNGLRSV